MMDFETFAYRLFGKNNKHLKVILIFYNNADGYFNNISGLAKILCISHVTARKVITDLVDIKILKEMDIGKSILLQINKESLYAQALFHFFNTTQDINKEKPKKKSVSIPKIIPNEAELSSIIEKVICPKCGSEMFHEHSGWFKCSKCGYSDEVLDEDAIENGYKNGVEKIRY